MIHKSARRDAAASVWPAWMELMRVKWQIFCVCMEKANSATSFVVSAFDWNSFVGLADCPSKYDKSLNKFYAFLKLVITKERKSQAEKSERRNSENLWQKGWFEQLNWLVMWFRNCGFLDFLNLDGKWQLEKISVDECNQKLTMRNDQKKQSNYNHCFSTLLFFPEIYSNPQWFQRFP